MIYNYIKLILVSLLLLSACSKDNEKGESSRHGGVIAIALNTPFEDFFPLTTDEYFVDQIHKYMLTPSFVSFDENENAIPNIANIWKIDEKNFSITFIINPDFKWSNGKHISINDIKYSFELNKYFNHLPRYESISKNIKEIKIIDSTSCQVSFNQAVAEPLYFTNIPIFPAENNYDTSDINKFKQSYIKNFIGCGPYVISNICQDSLTLIRNNFYHENLPYLDKVVFQFAGNENDLQNLLSKNKTDFIVNLPIDLLANKFIKQNFKILSYQEKGYTFIGWNLKSNILKNKDMRLALSYSIDRQTLIDGILGGYSEIINGPVYYHKKSENIFLPEIGFDATKAESIFVDLGWNELNSSGIRVKNGKTLSFSMLVNKENKERIEIANNMKANLKVVGVELKLQLATWKGLLESVESKSSDAILLTWLDGDYYDPSLLFHSKAIKGGLNFMSYKSSITDSLIDKALFSWQNNQKEYFWKEFQKQVVKDLPCTFLFSQKIIVACNKKIQNVRMNSRGFLPNIKEWWLE